jgi:hypothetical protein
MKNYILMADIIKSSKYNSNILIQEFKEISENINSKLKRHFYSPITITLGDEFQCVVKSLIKGIEVIFNFEEQILKYREKFKLRYVLNYGEIDTPINPDNAYEMLGIGLSAARETLGKLKKGKKRFFIKHENEELSKKLNLALFIYQSCINGWKEKDYVIVSSFIKNRDYKVVAKHLKKDVSLMWKREKSLKIKEYFAIKELILLLAKR